MNNPILVKEWIVSTITFRILRERLSSWYYLEKDGKIVAQSGSKSGLLEKGWYK